MARIDAAHATFSTIASFLRSETAVTDYELMVIDECTTVSNKDMVAVLNKAHFNMLLLVGDTYQIDAIQFGNWFTVLKYFLPPYAIFELTEPYRTKDTDLLELWKRVRNMSDNVKECIQVNTYALNVDPSLLSSVGEDEAILCLNYDGLYGINNINRFLQESNPNPAVTWDVQQYKVGDPVLFLESEKYHPVIHNNLKGVIRGIEIIDPGTYRENIQFDVEVQKLIDEEEAMWHGIRLLDSNYETGTSLVRFSVYKAMSTDEDTDRVSSQAIVPFQIAYAVSIHKAQGLEFNSVKIVITDEVEELVTHDIFYTAITRARENLKIYWTPETEEKVLKRIKPKDVSSDVEILKKYLNE